MSANLMSVGMELAEVYLRAGLVKSKTEFRNHVKNGAIKVADYKIHCPFTRIAYTNGMFHIIQDVRDLTLENVLTEYVTDNMIMLKKETAT